MKLDFFKINHKHIFLKALRTGLLFIIGFIVYELAIELEDPRSSRLKSKRSKILKCMIIIGLDVIILYLLYFVTGEYY